MICLAVNTGDVVQATMRQEYLGQEVENVYHLVVSVLSGVMALATLAEKLYELYVAFQSEFQNGDVTYYGLDVSNLTDGSRAAYRPASPEVGGGSSGGATTSEPSFLALSMTLLGDSGVTRSGGKRYAGLWEGAVNQNTVAVAGAWQVAAQDLFGATHNLDGGIGGGLVEVAHVIVGRDSGGGYDLTRLNNVVGAQFKVNVTTQNTRKKAKGI